MKTNRRHFLATSLVGGAAAALPLSVRGAGGGRSAAINAKYEKLDAVLKQPVLRRELFTSPVIIETIELLRYNNNFLCRVRSKDGAVGISAANNSPMMSVWPVQVNRLQNFFLGKDARDLEAVMEEAYVHQSNYKMQSLALWVPMATIEFAILDMLGRIANKPLGLLISDKIHNPIVKVYRANGERDNSAE
jgi:L-alanine-DL-glutamate epimerase-like enolase superfamily enzyme